MKLFIQQNHAEVFREVYGPLCWVLGMCQEARHHGRFLQTELKVSGVKQIGQRDEELNRQR